MISYNSHHPISIRTWDYYLEHYKHMSYTIGFQYSTTLYLPIHAAYSRQFPLTCYEVWVNLIMISHLKRHTTHLISYLLPNFNPNFGLRRGTLPTHIPEYEFLTFYHILPHRPRCSLQVAPILSCVHSDPITLYIAFSYVATSRM